MHTNLKKHLGQNKFIGNSRKSSRVRIYDNRRFGELDFCHLGIDELQCLLIKNALLLGVEVRLGAEYMGAEVKQTDEVLLECENGDATVRRA